jgi:hypothetical protein
MNVPAAAPTKTPPPGPAPKSSLPDYVVFGGGLLIALFATELLYKWKPGAGYAFAGIVVLGYLASGDRLDVVMAWLQKTGIVK